MKLLNLSIKIVVTPIPSETYYLSQKSNFLTRLTQVAEI